MSVGHRGKSYYEHARALPFHDWASAKDLLINISKAIDRLEATVFSDEDITEEPHGEDTKTPDGVESV